MLKKNIFAGEFYPDGKEELAKEIEGYLDDAPEPVKDNRKLKALLVPHAGFVYSGPVAAYAYKLLKSKHFLRVVILGLSHRSSFSGIKQLDATAWQGVFGEMHVDKVSEDLIPAELDAFDDEHSLEVQLPFLQKVMKDFSILPVLTGVMSNPDLESAKLAKVLKPYDLLVVSTDLSHYLPYTLAKRRDEETIKKILDLNSDIGHDEACGADGINMLLILAKKMNWKPELLDYRNSGDTAGDQSAVVGYTAIAFYE
jgi:AmmeMemoRadiSam system protein B